MYEGAVVVVDRMLCEFTTICAISTYHYYPCIIEYRSWRGLLDTSLCGKLC